MHSSALRRILILTALVLFSALLSALFLTLPGSNDTSEASHTTVRNEVTGSSGVPNCNDTLDNDGDTFVDAADPQCIGPTFNFTGDWQFCNDLPSGFGAPAPIPGPTAGGCSAPDRLATFSSNPDLSSNTLLAAGNLNYAQDTLVSFSPSSWTVSQGTTAIALGTAIGGVKSGTSLGLLTAACATGVFPEFIMWNASIDNSAGNVLTVDPEGTDARFDTMVGAGGDDDAFAGKADSDSTTISKYPDISNRFFDPDGSGDATGGASPVQPWARYASLTQVPAGGDYQLLQIFVFSPGALKTAFSALDANDTHPFARLDASYGWTTIVVLNDPTATIVSPNPISDFCTILDVDIMLLGDPPGAGTRLTMPADATTSLDGKGTFLLPIWVASTRDSDVDGIENPMDTCPFAANVQDPYSSIGPDSDALDSACDPTPGVNTNDGDHDGDVFLNNQDQCPLTADGGVNQKDSENSQDYDVGAPDGGPLGDSIGDACDSESGGSDTVSNGTFVWGMVTDALCVGSDADGPDAGTAPDLDNDVDGWCSASPGADPNDENASITGSGTQDMDGDGFPNSDEIFMNTDPIIKCSQDPIATAGVRDHDSWPADVVIDRVVNISDVFTVLPPAFGSSPPSASYSKRIDLAPDGVINITDVFKVLPPTFGSSCTGPQD